MKPKLVLSALTLFALFATNTNNIALAIERTNSDFLNTQTFPQEMSLIAAMSSKSVPKDLLVEGCALPSDLESGVISSFSLSEDFYIVDSSGSFLAANPRSSMERQCRMVKNINEGISAVQIALVPASIAFSSPAARALLTAQLVNWGLTLANPMVLSVAVVGSVGIVTTYIIFKVSEEECKSYEKDLLKAQIIKELKQDYNINADRSTEFIY